MFFIASGSSVHSFRFEAAFDCPADHLTAVAREFDLMSSWNGLSLDSAILAEPSIFTSVGLASLWPKSNMHTTQPAHTVYACEY